MKLYKKIQKKANNNKKNKETYKLHQLLTSNYKKINRKQLFKFNKLKNYCNDLISNIYIF